MPNIVPFTPTPPPATVDSDLHPVKSTGMRPCEPLTATRVWEVAEDAFKANGLKAAYKGSKRGYDPKRGCFWILVSDVPPHVLDVCLGQIGTELETDFTMCASDSQDGSRKYLVSINEMQNTTSEVKAAREAAQAEWNAMREKCRGIYIG